MVSLNRTERPPSTRSREPTELSGRQKHNAKWMAIYNNFVVGYESGMTMVEIAKRNNVSERTIYRYKAYYDKMKKKEE